MKRIFLLTFIFSFTIFVSSCSKSKDDNTATPAATGPLSAKINGNLVTFNVANVVKDVHADYTDLIVTLAKTDDATKQVVFNVEHLQTGTESCYYFLYAQNDTNFAFEVDNSFTTTVTVNTANNIKGTFEGKLYTEDLASYVTITEGHFDISF